MPEETKKIDAPTDQPDTSKADVAKQPTGEGEGDPKTPVGPYRPEGLPDHLYGESEKDIIDKLFKGYKGARDELSKSGKSQVPEKADDYKLDLPEDLAKSVLRPGEDGKDPMFEAMRLAAHKHGIPADKALAWVSDFYTAAAELSNAQGDGQSDADFDYKKLGGADKAKPIVDGVVAAMNGLLSRGVLEQSDVDELYLYTLHSEGVTALRKLIEATGDKIIPAKSESGGDGKTVNEAVLKQRVSDPRYRHGSKDFDQAFYDETTKMFEEFYGTEIVA
ncbi:MAG: hypothetical protein IAE63_06805 [Alphaproteobacteria bacterium]|nr:hypothetical protein [Alphaproteobacteria bacterium]